MADLEDKEGTPSPADKVRAGIAATREAMAGVRGELRTLEREWPGLQSRTAELRRHLMALACAVTEVDQGVAVLRMTGGLPGVKMRSELRTEELELFVLQRVKPVNERWDGHAHLDGDAALLRSLHRAGDHSYDPDPDIDPELGQDGKEGA